MYELNKPVSRLVDDAVPPPASGQDAPRRSQGEVNGTPSSASTPAPTYAAAAAAVASAASAASAAAPTVAAKLVSPCCPPLPKLKPAKRRKAFTSSSSTPSTSTSWGERARANRKRVALGKRIINAKNSRSNKKAKAVLAAVPTDAELLRAADFSGQTVGLWDISKTGGDVVLDAIERRLRSFPAGRGPK